MTTAEQMSKQFRLLTHWYLSVLEGIQPEDGSKVISENTNSLEWLAGHLLVSRVSVSKWPANRTARKQGRQAPILQQ